jgi:hypothetical protein
MYIWMHIEMCIKKHEMYVWMHVEMHEEKNYGERNRNRMYMWMKMLEWMDIDRKAHNVTYMLKYTAT